MNLNKDLPIIDREKLKSIIPEEIINEVLLIFLREIPIVQIELCEAWQQNNDKQLRDVLHKLIGRCKYCCFIRLENVIHHAQNAITEKPPVDNKYLKQIQQELLAIEQQLKATGLNA